jgi:zeta-carotene desaturase
MGVPTVPLTELYSVSGDYIQTRGGEVRLRSGVDCFRAESDGAKLLAGGREASFDFVVLAVPFDVLLRILPQVAAAASLGKMLSQFETSPITGIHLWFDRQITDLDHAVLLDRTIQWMFHKSKLLARRASAGDSMGVRSQAIATVEGHGFTRADGSQTDARLAAERGSYIELVVSSSKTLVEKSKTEIIDLALKELCEFFPAAREANLVKSTVIKEVHATYSPRPGIDLFRPASETAWPRIFLAGDWTATGWPATMEGAVRSGYKAAEGVLRASGERDKTLLVKDLPATGLMRLFS